MPEIDDVGEKYATFKKRIKTEIKQLNREKSGFFYYASCLEKQIKQNAILFESNSGFSMEGDPKAIFDQILKDNSFTKCQLIWVAKNENICKRLQKDYKDNQRIQFVVIKTNSYFEFVAEAKYIISDTCMPVWFIRREEQVYIQTNNRFQNFRLGYSQVEDYFNDVRKEIKDYLCSNVFLSPSEYYTQEVLEKQYKLFDLYEGKVIQAMPPRLKAIREMPQSEAKEKCSNLELDNSRKQILVTFGREGLLECKIKFCKELAEIIDQVKYQLCLKVTPTEYIPMKNALKGTKVLLLKNFYNMELWLAAADYLVGDGAGYTFDYLATGRMILFTDLYKLCKGEILTDDELPGPTAQTPEDVVNFIKDEKTVIKKYEKAYSDCVKKFISDGSEVTLFENGKLNDSIGKSLLSGKERLLIVAPLADLGKDQCQYWHLTLSHMLSQIDYDKYDVTLVSNRPRVYNNESMLEKIIDRRVRVIYRVGLNVQTEKKYMKLKYVVNNLFYLKDFEGALLKADREECRKEWIRICGYASFDEVIYYGPLISYFLIQVNAMDVKKKVFYDRRNYKKVFGGNTPVDDISRRRQENLFSAECVFDEIIHPSEDTITYLKEFEAYSDYSKHKSQEEHFIISPSKDNVSESVNYAGGRYHLNGKTVSENGKISLNLMKDLEGEHQYMLEVPLCATKELSEVLEKFLKIKREIPDAKLHIFDLYNQWGEQLLMKLQESNLDGEVFHYGNVFLKEAWNRTGKILDYKEF